jgi:hypothetical protein
MSEYEEDHKIDLHNLHKDWQNQPELYDKYGKKWAHAVKKRARLHERKKTKRAEIARSVRMSPESFGLDKLTEPAIDEIVRTDKEYIKIVDEMIDAQEEEDMLVVAKRTFEHRREALGGEGYLYGANYFSVPNLPKEVKEGLKKLAEKEREGRREEHTEALQSAIPRLKRPTTND